MNDKTSRPINVKKLLFIVRNEKLSKEERLKAIDDLQKISPTHFGNLTLSNIKDLSRFTKNFIESFLTRVTDII